MAKFSHFQVGFEHPAKGKDHCSQCEHWKGDSCSIVRPPVRAGDWCEKFEKKEGEYK